MLRSLSLSLLLSFARAIFRLFVPLSLTSSFAGFMRGLFPHYAKSDETRKFSTRLIYGHAARSKGVTKMKRLNTSVLLLLRLTGRLLTFPLVASAEMWPLFRRALHDCLFPLVKNNQARPHRAGYQKKHT